MAAECDVLSEIEVLQSIYLDELQAANDSDGGWEVSLVLYPSTAEDSVSQFVRLTLTLTLDQQYPFSSPTISIHNPRGLSDNKLSRCLRAEAESCLGSPVLYQLIEKAKEILTESNIPHGNCVICLYGFKEGEAFTKTSCYHYFHSHCLGRYVTHSETELRERERELEQDKTRDQMDQQELTVVCPVCREPLTYDADQLLSSPAPHFPKVEGGEIGTEFRQTWRELQNLLERQRAKGGIIDPELESNRFLICTNEVSSEAENGNPDTDVLPGQSLPPDETCVPPFQPHAAHWGCRGAGAGHRRQGQWKGPRRGRQHQYGKPAPPTERLNKLHLSSDSSHSPSFEAPIKARPQGQQKAGNSELDQTQTDGGTEVLLDLGSRASADPTGEQQMRHPNMAKEKSQSRAQVPNLEDRNAECSKYVGEPARGNPGRRRGHRGSTQQPSQWEERHARGTHQSDLRCGSHQHWEGRGTRSRGGGSRRGYRRGFHQRVVETDVEQEGVL